MKEDSYMFLIEEFKIIDNQLRIVISMKEEACEPYLCFRLRDNSRWWILEHNKEYKVRLLKTNDKYELTLDTITLVREFNSLKGQKNIIDLHIKIGNDYHKLIVNKEVKEYVEAFQKLPLNNLTALTLYITVNDTIGLQLLQNKVICKLNKISEKDDAFIFCVETSIGNKKSTFKVDSILLKKRKFKNVLVYSEEINIFKAEENKFVMPKDYLNKITLEAKTILDITAIYKEDNVIVETPLSLEDVSLDINYTMNINDNYNASFYKNKSNNISIRIQKSDLCLTVKDITLKENNINLEIDLPKAGEVKAELLLCSQQKISDEYYYDLYKSLKGTTNKAINTISFNLNIAELFPDNYSNYKRAYKLFVKLNNLSEDNYRLTSSDKTAYNQSFNSFIANLKTGEDFIIEVIPTQPNPIKLGVFGTCFSRAAFDSHKEYFNPDYKNYFKIEYSHFWPSAISLASEPIHLDKENFGELNERELLELERDYTKNTFEQLKNKKIDYILLDFFVDATHGTIKLGDNKYLVKNDTLRKTKYYKNTLIFEGVTFDSKNPEFMSLWMKYCDSLIEKLKEVVPEHKLILNTGKLTDKYYDENHRVQSFIKNNKITQVDFNYFNMIWCRMDNYFLSKLPNAQVIDMAKYGFISSFDHPVSCGPHHFESNYYKKLVDELLKLVVYNKQLTSS
jgi:hypothetical protein